MNMGMLAFLAPGYYERFQEQKKAAVVRRLKTAEFVPWDSKMKWCDELNIDGSTYSSMEIFPVESNETVDSNMVRKIQRVDSPSGQFRYMHNVLPVGHELSTWYGSKIGSVMFNSDVIVPAMYEKENHSGVYRNSPWMSFTPAEIFSFRGGTRRAKGKVVVAGLGLGHQLIEVSKRKKVTEIVLVERSQELVEWIMPVIRSRMRDVPLRIIVGDAYKELPKLEADVALVDIFPSYGNNDYARDKLRRACPSIGYLWCWGSAVVTGGGW